MSFDKYPAYKSSSLKWLGDIPESWELKRLKHLFSLVKRPVQEGNGIVTCFRDGTVTLRSKRRTEGFTNAVQEIGYQGVRAGDLVIHAMDAFAGAIGVSDSDGKSSPVYSVCVPKSQQTVLTEYYGKLLRNMALSGFVASLAKGIRERSTDFRWSDAGEIFLPVPSIHEQTQIARFLDHETAKIDALIREQECLIALLQEKRQAVISHVVTKGLDPGVPMKDSVVEWLGEVPAHWEVTRLKFISTIVDCKNRTPEYFDNGEYLVVRTSNVKEQTLNTLGAYYTDEHNFRIWTQRGVPPTGSILFTREAPAGEVCIVPEGVPLCLGQRMMNFIPHEPKHTSFIFDFLTSDCLVRYMESVAHGSTVTHLRVEQIYDIPLVMPPIEEQAAIDHKVSALKTQFRSLIEESETTVGLLKERRSALISAAVTGKIDVRNWQPPADESAFDEEVRQAGMEATA